MGFCFCSIYYRISARKEEEGGSRWQHGGPSLAMAGPHFTSLWNWFLSVTFLRASWDHEEIKSKPVLYFSLTTPSSPPRLDMGAIFPKERNRALMVVGLDNSGKTTILCGLKGVTEKIQRASKVQVIARSHLFWNESVVC
jgi:hypothetical protein